MRDEGMKLTEEHVRILRAAAEGRMGVNEHGRYVIDGEKRPERKAREELIYGYLITWPHHKTRKCALTGKGELALSPEPVGSTTRTEDR